MISKLQIGGWVVVHIVCQFNTTRNLKLLFLYVN